MYQSNFYFRARETNANIYRVADNSRRSNQTLNQIGIIAFTSEKIKLNDGEVITEEETEEIQAWLMRHKARTARVQRGSAEALILQMQQTAQWVQFHADDEDVETIFEDMLLALYDLRQSVVRRFAKAHEDKD